MNSLNCSGDLKWLWFYKKDDWNYLGRHRGGNKGRKKGREWLRRLFPPPRVQEAKKIFLSLVWLESTDQGQKNDIETLCSNNLTLTHFFGMNSLGQACHNDPFWGQTTFPLFITFAVSHPIPYCHNTCFSPPSGVLEPACTDLSNYANLFPTLQSVTSC